MSDPRPGGLPGLTERLRELKGDLSVAAFARRCGIGESLMRQYLAGGVPGLSWALKIARACGVSLDWLADASAHKFPDSTAYPSAGQHRPARVLAEPQPGSAEECTGPDAQQALRCYDPGRKPALPWNDAANCLGQFAFPGPWLAALAGGAAQGLVLLVARGDAMAPTLADGDLLLLDTTARQPGQEGVCALLLGGRLLIKRVQPLPERRVRLCSDNPAYQAVELPDDWDGPELQFVGRALWRAGRYA